MIARLWHRKPCELYGSRDPLLIDKWNRAAALARENLPAVYVKRHQESIGRTPRRRHCIAGFVDYEGGGCVARTHSPDISNIMTEQSDGEVHPILGPLHRSQMLAAEDFLTDKGHKHCVLKVMIRCIAICDYFQNCACRQIQFAWIRGFFRSEHRDVIRFKMIPESIRQNLRWI